MKKLTIIAGGGHGFLTPGKRSHDFDGDGLEDLRENEFNDFIVSALGYALREDGHEFHHISMEWWDVSLKERTRRANEIYKADPDNTYFISIHSDAFEYSRKANGFGTFAITRNSEYAKLIHKHIGRDNPLRDRGIKQASFYMLRKTKMPAVLCEMGFMTNPGDCAYLMDIDYRYELVTNLRNAFKELANG